jgi:hypothetical protein
MLNQLQRGDEPALLPCRRSGFLRRPEVIVAKVGKIYAVIITPASIFRIWLPGDCVNEASCSPFSRFLPLAERKIISCSRLTALTLPPP